MNNEYFAQIESELDTLRTRVAALEKAVTQIPQITYEVDPSKLPGVRVQPAALVAN